MDSILDQARLESMKRAIKKSGLNNKLYVKLNKKTGKIELKNRKKRKYTKFTRFEIMDI